MAKNCDHTFLNQHLGTEQSNRSRNPLVPEQLKLNEFTVEDWMQFAYAFAKKLNYFNDTNHTTPDGDWTAFLVEKEEIKSFLASHEDAGTMTPHLTLFVCFLKLLEFTQEKFNALTKRHVDFYYGNILQLEKKQPIADSAHLIFELAKNAQTARIVENTVALGGKDATGTNRNYKTNTEAVINTAAVTALKSVYHHRKATNAESIEYNGIVAADVANSEDGIAEPFANNEPWFPFGFPGFAAVKNELPIPKIGFAMAAPILALQEGVRTITVTTQLEKPLINITEQDRSKHFQIFATGPEGWIGPLSIQNNSETSATSLVFSIPIDFEAEAIVNYNNEIHEGNFETTAPMLKFELQLEHPQHAMGYQLYTQLMENTIEHIEIDVQVQKATSLQLSSDIGNLKADKPFYPFGTQPIKNGSFYIDFPEAFAKQWNSVTVQGDWLDTPDNFVQHYIAYRKKGNNTNLSPNNYFQVLYFKDNQTATGKNAGGFLAPTSVSSNQYVTNNDYFKAAVSVKKNGAFVKKISNLSLFSSTGSSFANGFSIQNPSRNLTGPIELTLNQSFLHREYPKIIALSMGSEQDTLLPNEPYTPFAENLSLNYTASEKKTFNAKATTQHNGAIQLFHLHPFGQAENNKTLVPAYCKGGALFIGLSNTIALQQAQLLLQLLEGTENPQVPSFSESEKISWSFLSENKWIPFGSDYFLGDTTDNLLKTGIVSVIIPPEATTTNTLLPEGMVWLKAENPKRFDAVCKCLSIQAQVITATFEDQNNELSHLVTGLAATSIAKLQQRNPLVKKVTQPYASFGGSPEETDPAFYQRVSERLRHKDRAITLWDYEHLILEQFKAVHKVKCLNHTKGDNFNAPGHVALIVIPDIVNQNAFDIFQPRLSTAKRNEISDYINALNSFFVIAEVVNPLYEEITVSLGVKFKDGYDPAFYEKEVDRAIQEYLSPWAFSETAELNFGISFHQSNLIAYLEQQPYVDYLVDVEVYHHTEAIPKGTKKVNILPSNPKAILVSAKKHIITVINSKCIETPKSNPSVCLP